MLLELLGAAPPVARCLRRDRVVETLQASDRPPALPPSAADEIEAKQRGEWWTASVLGATLASSGVAVTVHALHSFTATAALASGIGFDAVIAGLSSAVLAGTQARVLRGRYTRALAKRWVAVSTAAAALSCALAGLALQLSVPRGVLELTLETRLASTLIAGGLFGLVLGSAQAIALRSHGPQTRRFIAASVLGWLGATPILALAAMLCQLDRAWWEELAFSAAAGLLAGEVLGAMTGAALPITRTRAAPKTAHP